MLFCRKFTFCCDLRSFENAFGDFFPKYIMLSVNGSVSPFDLQTVVARQLMT